MAKNKNHRMMRLALLLVTVPLWHACSDDAPADGTVQKETMQIEVRPYTPWFQEEVIQSRTRAFPQKYGYNDYTYYYNNGIFATQSSIVGSTINLWFTQSPSTSVESIFNYDSGSGKWNSAEEMQPSNNYYIYGIIPQEVVTGSRSISPFNGDYQNGAVITLNGLSSVTPSDICFAVAAGNGDASEPADGYNIGKFSYQASSPGETNYIYLLFDHLYASLHFSFKVDATYNALRTIKLKKLQLQSTSMKEKVDATITLVANSEGTSPISSVSFSDGSYSAMGTDDGILFDGADNPLELTTTASDFIGCFAPALSDYPEFTLTSTYDVYDKPANDGDKHLIREDCIATNTITLSGLATPLIMTRGKMLTINLTVNPTYLYMLSEPDLDNPTITIQ